MKYIKLLFCLLAATTASFAQEIVMVEYFVDTDPGYGMAKPLELTKEGEEYLIDFTEELSALSGGFHTIQARAKDDQGNWSHNAYYIFYIDPEAEPENKATQIVEVEYYIDQDPGFGKGKNFGFTPGEDITLNVVGGVEDLSIGKHTLFVRAKDDLGNWSHLASKDFNICIDSPPLALFDHIISGNSITILDSAQHATAYLYSFGDGTTSNLSSPRHTYQDVGVYEVCQTIFNTCDTVSFCKTAEVIGIQTYSPQKGGNSGEVSLRMSGFGFDSQTKVTLAGPASLEPQTIDYNEDGTLLTSTFSLRNARAGNYTLRVEFLAQNQVVEKPFEIVPDDVGGDPWVAIDGRNLARIGRQQTFNVTYGNNGLVDAVGVPLWIEVYGDTSSLKVELDLEYLDLPMDVEIDSFDVIKPYFYMDSLYFEEGETIRDGILYPLIIPHIAAGETSSLNLKITSNTDFEIVSWVNEPMFGSPLKNAFKECTMEYAKAKIKDIAEKEYDKLQEELIDNMDKIIPGVGCATELYNFIEESGNRKLNATTGENVKYAFSWIKNYATTIASCAGGTIKSGGRLALYAYRFLGALRRINKSPTIKAASRLLKEYEIAEGAMESCMESQNDGKLATSPVRAVTSFDPNEKTGFYGNSDQNYTRGKDPFNYRVYFENVDTAQAPAQEVIIVDSLDIQKLDLNTFSLGRIAFGKNKVITPPPGASEFSTDVDIRPVLDLIVRVNAKLERSTGVVRWQFLSLDPQTLEFTEEPMLGFLPPNIDKGEGEGFVSYTVKPFNDLSTGTVISNFADIFFDFNKPIRTNSFVNTIDKASPRSEVTSLAQTQTDSVFFVEWGGHDNDAGISAFNVWVSTNDGPYELWLYNVTSASSQFSGQPDSTYHFYTIAKDKAGNVEGNKSIAEASTIVQMNPTGLSHTPKQEMKIYPNPARDKLIIELEQNHPLIGKKSNIILQDLSGKRVYRTSVNGQGTSAEIVLPILRKGIYFLILTSEKQTFHKKVLVE